LTDGASTGKVRDKKTGSPDLLLHVGSGPAPRPTPPGGNPVLNRGKDCWVECQPGLCSWCGQGNLCCRKGWMGDPQTCKAVPPSQYITAHHECVPGPTSPTPAPQRPTPRPTPSPATPAPGPAPPCRDTDARCSTKWKGKCNRQNVQRKCRKSCNLCDKCVDWNKSCPTKLKDKCSMKKTKEKCPLTCGVCSINGSR